MLILRLNVKTKQKFKKILNFWNSENECHYSIKFYKTQQSCIVLDVRLT